MKPFSIFTASIVVFCRSAARSRIGASASQRPNICAICVINKRLPGAILKLSPRLGLSLSVHKHSRSRAAIDASGRSSGAAGLRINSIARRPVLLGMEAKLRSPLPKHAPVSARAAALGRGETSGTPL